MMDSCSYFLRLCGNSYCLTFLGYCFFFFFKHCENNLNGKFSSSKNPMSDIVSFQWYKSCKQAQSCLFVGISHTHTLSLINQCHVLVTPSTSKPLLHTVLTEFPHTHTHTDGNVRFYDTTVMALVNVSWMGFVMYCVPLALVEGEGLSNVYWYVCLCTLQGVFSFN